jgi:hypothetical protein
MMMHINTSQYVNGPRWGPASGGGLKAPCGGPFGSISRGAVYRVKSPIQRVHKPKFSRAWAVMQEITNWLTKLGLPEYAGAFSENGIDVSVLPILPIGTSLCMSGNPVPDGPDFLVVVFVGLDRRRRAIEYGDRVAPVIGIAIDVDHNGAEHPVRLCAYLV